MPLNLRLLYASTSTSAESPMWILTMSFSPTSTRTSITAISATVIISVPMLKLLPATRSPFFTFKEEITPLMGAVKVVRPKSLFARLSPTCVPCTPACKARKLCSAARRLARADRRVVSYCSNSALEITLSSYNFLLRLYVISACSKFARNPSRDSSLFLTEAEDCCTRELASSRCSE